MQEVRAANNSAWMQLVRLAWRVAPDEARRISREINRNDAKITKLARRLAR